MEVVVRGAGKYISYLELSQNWEPKTLSHGLKHQYLLAIYWGYI